MRYKVLTEEGIATARAALTERKSVPDLTAHEALIGAGDMLDEASLRGIASRIRKEQQELKKLKLPPEELDRRCFDIVHETLSIDDPALLSDMAFWTRFAIIELADVIYARFPGRKGKMNLDNFGLGSRKECWPYKLWVRGELSHSVTGKDPYAIGRFGGVDVWTSHVHRQQLMSVRPIFRGVFAVQYPKELKGKPLLFEGEEDPAKGGKPGLRTLMKRLKENWASVEYCCLSDSEAVDLVRYHCKGLCRVDGKPVF